MAGRKTLLTEKVQTTICEAIQQGNWFETSCRLAGISPDTGREWLERGEGRSRDRPANFEYMIFADAVRQAEAVCESKKVKEVFIAGDPLEFLSRRFPARWGKNPVLELSGVGGGPIAIREIVVEHRS